MFFPSMYATYLAYFMLLDLNILIILFGEGRHENYGAPHYATLFGLLVLHPSYVQIFSSQLVLKHPWPVFFS
jgi:hypothetical protein